MVTVPAWAVPAAMGDLGWVSGKRVKFLAGEGVWRGGRLRPLAGPAPPKGSPVQLLPLFWAAQVLSWTESRAHGAPCAGFWEAVPTLLFLMLSEPALPEFPCVLGRLHTVLLAFFFQRQHLSDGELCKWKCKLDSAPGCLARLPAVLSAGKLHPLAPRETFKHVIPLLFSLIKVIVPQPSIE